MDFLLGRFLVAASQQFDPNFLQAVVLVVRHVPQGAFGVVVNCPAAENGGLYWQRMTRRRHLGQPPPHWGGPVAGPLMALHTDASLAEIDVLPDLYFTARQEHIARVICENQHPYKTFLGYAGWGPCQLEHEIARGVWRTAPASVVQALSQREGLWYDVHRQALASAASFLYRVKHIPPDPSVN